MTYWKCYLRWDAYHCCCGFWVLKSGSADALNHMTCLTVHHKALLLRTVWNGLRRRCSLSSNSQKTTDDFDGPDFFLSALRLNPIREGRVMEGVFGDACNIVRPLYHNSSGRSVLRGLVGINLRVVIVPESRTRCTYIMYLSSRRHKCLWFRILATNS